MRWFWVLDTASPLFGPCDQGTLFLSLFTYFLACHILLCLILSIFIDIPTLWRLINPCFPSLAIDSVSNLFYFLLSAQAIQKAEEDEFRHLVHEIRHNNAARVPHAHHHKHADITQSFLFLIFEKIAREFWGVLNWSPLFWMSFASFFFLYFLPIILVIIIFFAWFLLTSCCCRVWWDRLG